jgi:dienelactone hydrolase
MAQFVEVPVERDIIPVYCAFPQGQEMMPLFLVVQKILGFISISRMYAEDLLKWAVSHLLLIFISDKDPSMDFPILSRSILLSPKFQTYK